MIDIKLIRQDPESVRRSLLKRQNEVDLDPIIELDRRSRSLTESLNKLQSQRNVASAKIGELKRDGIDATQDQAEATELGARISELKVELEGAQSDLRNLLMQLPNLPDPRVPEGDKDENIVLRTWGEKPDLPSNASDHVELCTRLGLVDYERGTKLGGRGYWIYRGLGAALEWALLDFFCREHFSAGYEFLLPPHILTEASGYASGQFPKFYDDVFHLESDEDKEGSFLLPTSETAILNIYRDEIIPGDALPLKLFSYTPCYRREAGAYRSEERGTIRGHQFNKVEQFFFVEPETAEDALQEMLERTEGLMQKLGLHYQTSLLASRDVGASMALTYDVEVWLPSLGIYKEVSSVSWASDYQARRGNIRYRPGKGSPTKLVHTLNGSGLATSRLLPAIVEQNQKADGSIVVPEPLRAWLGLEEIPAES